MKLTPEILQIVILILSGLGAFLSGLFFYFLNSLKKSNDQLRQAIQSLNQKIDNLKQKYYSDVSGFGKIFVFKNQLQKSQAATVKREDALSERLKRLQNAYDNSTRK